MVDLERPSPSDGDGGSPSKRARLMLEAEFDEPAPEQAGGGISGSTPSISPPTTRHFSFTEDGDDGAMPTVPRSPKRAGKSAAAASASVPIAGQMDIRRFFKQGGSPTTVSVLKISFFPLFFFPVALSPPGIFGVRHPNLPIVG